MFVFLQLLSVSYRIEKNHIVSLRIDTYRIVSWPYRLIPSRYLEGQGHSMTFKQNSFRPITLWFEVEFYNYFTGMIIILRQRVLCNIWVATLKAKVTAWPCGRIVSGPKLCFLKSDFTKTFDKLLTSLCPIPIRGALPVSDRLLLVQVKSYKSVFACLFYSLPGWQDTFARCLGLNFSIFIICIVIKLSTRDIYFVFNIYFLLFNHKDKPQLSKCHRSLWRHH